MSVKYNISHCDTIIWISQIVFFLLFTASIALLTINFNYTALTSSILCLHTSRSMSKYRYGLKNQISEEVKNEADSVNKRFRSKPRVLRRKIMRRNGVL